MAATKFKRRYNIVKALLQEDIAFMGKLCYNIKNMTIVSSEKQRMETPYEAQFLFLSSVSSRNLAGNDRLRARQGW